MKGEFIGYIIGKEGSKIKEIKEEAGGDVKIDMPKVWLDGWSLFDCVDFLF